MTALKTSMLDTGGYKMLERKYTVKSIAYLEMNRMTRPTLLPGFPYISFNAVETLELMGAMKVLHRDSVMEAIFDNGKRDRVTKITAANKVLNLLVTKGYAKVVADDHTLGYFYGLDERGLKFLRLSESEAIDEVSATDLALYYALNRVFVSLCNTYRETGSMEWVATLGEEWDAACLIRSKQEGQKPRGMVIKILRSYSANEQTKEIKELIEKYAGKEVEGFASPPDIVVAAQHKEDGLLELTKNGEACVTDDNIREWVL